LRRTANKISVADLWAHLELRHLLTLDAIAREGSFWAAAEALDCSQSAVSQQLAALERIAGHRLVERSRGRREVSLTEAGRLLLNHAEAIVARLRAASADLVAYSEGAASVLRVGSYQSVAQRIVPALLREFAASWPQVDVRLEERATDTELMELVERGELDLAFGIQPVPPGPIECVELMRDPYFLVVPAGSPLGTGDRPPRVRDLRGLPMIGNRSCHTVNDLTEFLRSRGVEPNVVFQSDDNGTVQAAVAAGIGVALLPRLALDPNDEGVRMIRTEELPWRTLVLAWHRDRYRSPASHAFEETALAICSRVLEAA
jgi:molybdate transport repressor ModE-like protein